MGTFIIILSVVWSVLSIILFFKVWGMTNDIKAIRDDRPQNSIDIVTQFAWAFSANLTKIAMQNEMQDFEILSFEGVDSVTPYEKGGFLVESRWNVAVKGNSNSYVRSFNSVITCNDLTKLMDIQSWSSSMIA